MASVFKATYTRQDAKTGKIIRKKYRKWSIKYKGADGKFHVIAGLRDKEASLVLARKLELRAQREIAGIHDPFEDHAATELSAHLDAYEAHLKGKGDCDDHVARSIARAKAIIDFNGWTRISEIDGSAVVSYLDRRRKAKENRISKQTSNYYLTAIRGFTRWLMKSRRSAVNPLDYLSPLSTHGQRSRDRRAATPEQFAAIVEAAKKSTAATTPAGPDRAVIYVLAAYTGLRASELASLSPASFNLGQGTVTVEAAYSKRRRRDTQPLRADLVELLREYFAGKPAKQPLWPGNWKRRAAEMLRADLEAAKVPYVEDGKHLDFHALRHTYITSLHKGGTYGRVLQSLARHSTPMLTARYTHVDASDVGAALSGLPALPTDKK